jgi:hypothetical protein
LASSFGAAGGRGGFGGGGGAGGWGSTLGASGLGGYGGDIAFESGGGGGAGFGGAIFIRSGHLTVTDAQFAGSTATGGNSATGGHGLAKGGALFAIHQIANANGNDAGMPAALPVVSGCGNIFGSSAATDAGSANRDNVDVYGADRLGLTLACDDRIFASGFDPP